MNEPSTVIAGGGVIGLSIAYALAREGVRSAVLDRRDLGREASWAGAGILAPRADRPGDSPAARFRDLSVRLHAEWFEALRDETGVDNGYRRCGGLDLALSAPEEDALDDTAAAWRAEGIACQRLDARAVAELEPSLDPAAVRSAWLLPDRAQVRNPRHMQALALACRRRGVQLLPDRGVEGFTLAGDRVVAVQTPQGPLPCERLVIASGAWSGGLLAKLGLELPTPPVKGQIVLLNAREIGPRRIVEAGRNYLVPREDGRILVGATEESAGFDTRPTADGVSGLIQFALRLCPALAGAEIERAWAGLRPGSRDGQPLIGPAPGFANVLIATGHRRAGLQLSTGTAVAAAAWVLEKPSPLDLTPFRPDRPPTPPRDDLFRS